ncbi:unnamed protein product [Spirodela intermedia]|uniref:Uncharacterized protein n=1 Tax=Spirodela intermedia TaxID=51605 RepID=A0A7I8K5B0_SPIIN|nr:unnamed protein product [Spirodela intermedia]
MVMDRGTRELPAMIDGLTPGDHPCEQGVMNNGLKSEDQADFLSQDNLVNLPFFVSAVANGSSNQTPPASASPQGYSPEDSEIFSDIALSYISEMLMEEEMDDKLCIGEGVSALDAIVEPFFLDVLGEKSLSSSDGFPLYADTSPEDSSGHGTDSVTTSEAHMERLLFDVGCPYEMGDHPPPTIGAASANYDSRTSFSPSDSISDIIHGIDENQHQHQFGSEIETNSYEEIQPAREYRRGVEEASKFLPDQNRMVIDLEASSSPPSYKEGEKDHPPRPGGLTVEVKVEKEEKSSSYSFLESSRTRKNPHRDGFLSPEEERSTKQSAVYSEDEDVPSEMFDRVLLCPQGRPNDAISALRKVLQSEVSKASKNNGNFKGGGGGQHGGKARGRRQQQQPKKEVVDLRTLLIHCAQAVAADDRRTAQELLKQIRSHASRLGDGSQRLAICFADGIEARLTGTGIEMYHALSAKSQSAAAILKAYHLYLAACPFKKISHFYSNQTILNAAEGSSRLHIIDFGIYFGFQWPCLIQRLSMRPGGPPKLRITGIESPQPGFRPNERVVETGRRLQAYAEMFNVPFEYHPIAAKWEAIRLEDLQIDREPEEVLVVNCLYRFRHLADETVEAGSPRDQVLRSIRKMNPDVFVQGVLNGSYGAPFFLTRFREALFHFSALFDMLETTVPREHPERLLIEREIFGPEAVNVIACEGSERVERPETYKQWQGRNLRAGFVQVKPNRDIMKKSRDKVTSCYNKDFLVDEDSGWLLQGWKGRIIYALSTWRPNRQLLGFSSSS